MNYSTKLTSLNQTQKTFLSIPKNKQSRLVTLNHRHITDRNSTSSFKKQFSERINLQKGPKI